MKDIEGYEGLYAITSCGRVWSYRNKKFLAPRKHPKGYLQVLLSKNGIVKGFLIHRLVAEAYIPNPNNLPQINHKDEDKTHNWINNLEWCDNKYNNNYGNKNNTRRKKVHCIELNLDFSSQTAAAKYFNGSSSNISACLCGRTETAYRYHWEYMED